MFNCIFRWISVALLVLLVMSPAGARDPEAFYAGEWNGERYYDETSGTFEYCLVAGEYVGGETLYFLLDRDYIFELWMVNPEWRLDEGTQYPVKIYIDGNDMGDHWAEARNDQSILISLPYTNRVVENLMRGQVLTVYTVATELSYRLSGTFVAITELEKCVAMAVAPSQRRQNPFAGGNATNPFGGDATASNPFGGQKSGKITGGKVQSNDAAIDTSEDGAEMIELMLEAAGLDDYRYIRPGDSVTAFPDAIHGWTNGEVIGSLMVYDGGGYSLSSNARTLIGVFSDEICDGRFKYGVDVAPLASGLAAQRVLGACLIDHVVLSLAFLMFDYDGSFFVILHLAAGDGATDVMDADQRLYDVFYELL